MSAVYAPAPRSTSRESLGRSDPVDLPITAIRYAQQAEKLSHLAPDAEGSTIGGLAVRADWVTPKDPVIITADGGRLPGVPLAEATKLNRLRDELEGDGKQAPDEVVDADVEKDGLGDHEASSRGNDRGEGCSSPKRGGSVQKSGDGSLRRAMPPSRTNPLFPPLPLYGPPSILRNIQCMTFRATSAILSLTFLGLIVVGSAVSSIPLMCRHIWLRLTFRNPDKRRPFFEEERRRAKVRKATEKNWRKKRSRRRSQTQLDDNENEAEENDGFIPTEGGRDPLVCDIGYYARRVGLDVEEYKVQTEDGFVLTLWHVYNPREFIPLNDDERQHRGPEAFVNAGPSRLRTSSSNRKKKYPVLMMHGLLQSAGAYCTNDDDSLAFFLCKAGYDVWLGNNRCGFKPQHTLLQYSDPRMWAWNIRQMGVMDLPALISRVLSETGFRKLGLVCHSQGTTETFVALAKEQRPDLGDKITVFCALAPATHAGPLIGKMYFKFMRVISPSLFRIIFGIHAFIPFMMTMHAHLPGTLYGAMGYRVFSFLFNWTDDRWDRGLRDRQFQFAPVYVSAESMRWWLGRECFAKQKCILQTREQGKQEDAEDAMEEYYAKIENSKNPAGDIQLAEMASKVTADNPKKKLKGSTAWYDEHVPPFALWVCGSDDLVDGRRLLRRFERGREPHVRVVHAKIIEEYEHLDVIWAIDSIEKVGKEVRDVLWKTCDVRDQCRVPKGCEDVAPWIPEGKVDKDGGPQEVDDMDMEPSSSEAETDVANRKPLLSRRSLSSIWSRDSRQ